MQVSPRIRFRGMDPSQAVDDAVQKHIDRLARVHNRITSCEVVIEAPSRHSQQGGIFHVRAHVVIPGDEVVASSGPDENHAHEDVYVAIRDCFDAARRLLEDDVRKQSGYRVKHHPEKLHGTIARLVPEEGFGFIRDADGKEFFFRQESVTSDEEWNELKVGTSVRFAEHEGEKGPHASGVSIT